MDRAEGFIPKTGSGDGVGKKQSGPRSTSHSRSVAEIIGSAASVICAVVGLVVLVGWLLDFLKKKTETAGCDAYVAKPLRYQEWYAAINAPLVKGEVQVP
jgi:hypothetical protein